MDQPIDNYYMVEAEGVVNLGPAYGTVRVVGMTLDEAKKSIEEKLSQMLREPEVSVKLARVSGSQPLTAQYLVGPDGTINLRQYGLVHVAGLTVTEAKLAIQKHLAHYLDSPELSVDVVVRFRLAIHFPPAQSRNSTAPPANVLVGQSRPRVGLPLRCTRELQSKLQDHCSLQKLPSTARCFFAKS